MNNDAAVNFDIFYMNLVESWYDFSLFVDSDNIFVGPATKHPTEEFGVRDPEANS